MPRKAFPRFWTNVSRSGETSKPSYLLQFSPVAGHTSLSPVSMPFAEK